MESAIKKRPLKTLPYRTEIRERKKKRKGGYQAALGPKKQASLLFLWPRSFVSFVRSIEFVFFIVNLKDQ